VLDCVAVDDPQERHAYTSVSTDFP